VIFWIILQQCGGLTLAGHLVPPTLSLPLLSWTGERKYIKSFLGQGKDRETSLSNYYHGQNRFDLGKINLIYYPTNQSRIMRNKTIS